MFVSLSRIYAIFFFSRFTLVWMRPVIHHSSEQLLLLSPTASCRWHFLSTFLLLVFLRSLFRQSSNISCDPPSFLQINRLKLNGGNCVEILTNLFFLSVCLSVCLTCSISVLPLGETILRNRVNACTAATVWVCRIQCDRIIHCCPMNSHAYFIEGRPNRFR